MHRHGPENVEGGFTLIELLLASLLLSLVIVPALSRISVSLERLRHRQEHYLAALVLAQACLAEPIPPDRSPACRDTTLGSGAIYRIQEERTLVGMDERHTISILFRRASRWDTLWTVTRERMWTDETVLR